MTWVKRTGRVSAFAGFLFATLAVGAGCAAPQMPTPGITEPASVPPTTTAVVAPATIPPPREDGRLPGGVAPRKYRWEVSVDPARPGFSGVMHISVHLDTPTRVIVMHGRGLTVKSAKVSGAFGILTASTGFRKDAHSKGEADELVVIAPATLPAGDAMVDIAYEAPFAPGLHGLYRVEEGGKTYAFTQFEPIGARLAFPCFDEPGFKVPFEVAVTAPKEFVALSNMPEDTRTPSPDGALVTTEFEPSPPLPTYLVAIAVGPIELREGQPAGEIPVRLGAVAGRTHLGDFALVAAREHLGILQKYFGSPYPYPKLDLLAVPNFAAGAMENAGLITFREERLLLDPATASASMRIAVSGTIAHELAHMWFGDLVTLGWWNDIWLNEGFATWMATRVLDAWKPEFGAGVAQLDDAAYVLGVDTLASARKVRQPVRSTTEALEAFDGITYQKGAALLGMVERWITPDVFQKGVTNYLSDHRFGSATASDLFSALGRASGQDVAGVLGSFTEQTGVPAVGASTCAMAKGSPVVTISETEYRPLGSAAATGKRWQIPVCLHFAEATGRDRICGVLGANAAPLRMTLPGPRCPRWIHPNADQAGYYRSVESLEAFQTLAKLPLGTLSVRERVGVLMDAWAAAQAGKIGAGDFLSLAEKFRSDPEQAVWQRIIVPLQLIDEDIVAPADKPALAAFAKRLLGPEARALGWESSPKEPESDRLRRKLVLEALGRIGHDDATLAKARAVTERWLADPKSVDGDSATVALPLSALNGDTGLFERFLSRLSAAETPSDRVLALTALASFTDPALVRRALGLVLDGTVRVQDQIYIFRGIFNRSATRDMGFQVVSEKVDQFLAKIPPFARGRTLPAFAQACSDADADRARKLFEPRLASMEGGDRGLAQALELAHRCAALREFHRTPLGAWLASPGKPANH